MARNPNPLGEPVRALLEGVRTVLLDFDGVIADTEVHQLAAYRQVLAGYGVPLDAEAFKSYMGRSEAEIYALLRRTHGLDLDIEVATAQRLSLFFAGVRDSGLQPHAFVQPLLVDLRQRQVPAHIVSSNVTATIERLLQTWRLDALIDGIFSVGDAGARLSKLELLTALPGRLGVSAAQIAVFEDSAQVIAAAREAGMRTVGVHHSLNRTTPLGAHVEFDAM